MCSCTSRDMGNNMQGDQSSVIELQSVKYKL
jgi:hypothetical protein